MCHVIVCCVSRAKNPRRALLRFRSTSRLYIYYSGSPYINVPNIHQAYTYIHIYNLCPAFGYHKNKTSRWQTQTKCISHLDYYCCSPWPYGRRTPWLMLPVSRACWEYSLSLGDRVVCVYMGSPPRLIVYNRKCVFI